MTSDLFATLTDWSTRDLLLLNSVAIHWVWQETLAQNLEEKNRGITFVLILVQYILKEYRN
jgi:hypothetical protein